MSETLRSHSNTTHGRARPRDSASGRSRVGGSVRNTTTDVASDRAVSQVVDTTNRAGIGGTARADQPHHARREHHLAAAREVRRHAAPELLAVAAAAAAAFGRPVGPEPVVPAVAGAALERASKASRNSPRCSWSRKARTSASTRGCAASACSTARRGRSSFDERFTGNLLQFARMVELPQRHVPGRHAARGAGHRHHRRPDQRHVQAAGGRALGPAAASRAWSWRRSSRPARRPASRSAAARTTSTFSRPGSTRCATNTSARRRGRRSSAACCSARTASSTPASARRAEGGGLVVTSSNASVSPLFRVVLDPGRFDIGGIKTLSSAQIISTRTRALETTTRWNAIEQQVTTLLSNG